MALVAEDVKSRSEVYHGEEICQVKSKELLKEIALPNGLLPLKDIEECEAHVEKGKISKLTGVKTKEILLWITLSDIYVDDPLIGKITFKPPRLAISVFSCLHLRAQREEGPARRLAAARCDSDIDRAAREEYTSELSWRKVARDGTCEGF
ncbi:uncharacterized protein LOC106755354 [Vigna radiata var. radiata]|uniref:Uncharacterized protein LOC106755354 n=1 Tax=Vigna radiata var. radiata TaxID=3916 RepID=A0A1S3TGT2_VIGRR|nr:uncharacterized protein LOC106755354 [Vigna radiata var. radiata]